MELELKRQTTKTLITKLTSVSDQTRVSALCELRLLTKNDPQIRPFLAQDDTESEGGALSLLAEALYSPSSLAQENAAATLLNISISCKKALITNRVVLDSLAYILSHHRTHPPAAVQSAAATMYSLCVDEGNRVIIGGKREVVYSLIDILGFRDSCSRTMKDALKALFGVSLCDLNRPLMVEFGAVDVLFEVVVRDKRVGVVEDATAVIAQVAGCEESVAAFRKVDGVKVLVEMLSLETGVRSRRVRENAVSGLLSLVRVGGEAVAEEVREVGLGLVFDGLGEVVESGSDKGKKRAQALIKILEDGMSMSMSVKDDGDDDDGNRHSGSDLYSGPLLDCSSSYSY